MQNIFIDILPPWVETGLQPAFYDLESGTVLQQTARMYAKVRELGEAFNTFTEDVTETVNNYISRFNELYTYVHDYFDNLDVQEEINNKLDAMLEDGTLQEIVENYVQPHIIWTFDSVADMTDASNLVDGCYARTYGYYEYEDGGGADYRITDTEPASGFYIALTNGNYAELVIKNNTVYTKQTGAKGDGETDDTSYLKPLFDYVTNNQIHNFTIVVNGLHFVQPNQLIIEGIDSDNRLSGFSLIGTSVTGRAYMNQKTINEGFIFDSTDYKDNDDFGNTVGVYIHYTNGTTVQHLTFTTNESVSNGELPLNAIEALKIDRSRFYNVSFCNLTNAYVGFYAKDGGGGYVEKNNVSLCNLGIWLNQSGDCVVSDNDINTIGWNIYGIDGVLKSAYTTLRSNGHLYAQGIYVGGSGSHTIKGGKIEWCCIGIWQDQGTLMTYTDILFDRCTVTGIALTGKNKLLSRATISNNRFVGCGGVNISSGNPDIHISGIGRSCIGALEAVDIMVSNNQFIGDNGALHGAFKTSSNYYGPIYAVYFNQVTNSSVINNIVEIDNQSGANNYGFTFYKSDVLYDNNTTNAPYYPSNETFVYKQRGFRKEIYCNDPSNMTIGNFDVNDIIYNTYDFTHSWRVGVAGTKQSISTSVSVVTVGTDIYPGDGSVIDLGTSYVQGVRIGAYIEIAGVTGVKKIVDVLYTYTNNHYYAKLDSACDVAVLNATMTNKAPTFISLD